MFRTVCFAALCGASVLIAQDLPGMAAGVLAQSDAARQAVRNRDQQAALDHIRQAQNLAVRILNASTGRPQPILIPVHSTTETTTMYTDVKRSKDGELTANRMKKRTHASDVESATSADQLNVTTAVDNLDAAYASIQHENWTDADTELGAVFNLVHTDTTTYPEPLMQAHQNLMLARARVANQEFKAAVMPLRQAGAALSSFEERDRGPLAQQAEDMRQDIEAMASHVSREGNLATIDDWLHTLERWQNTRKNQLQPPQRW
jgi:hypothetical protein